MLAAAAACGDVNGALTRLADARREATTLQVAFARASDAANRAVMAETDEASAKYAEDANAARQQVRAGIAALRPLLEGLGYADETQVLARFEGHFGEYESLDRQILALAIENSNLKAQRLSFDDGQAAADSFRDAIEAAVSGGAWRQKAMVETAIAAIRDIQALQARHIAEPNDASMTSVETRIQADEKVARDAVRALPAVEPTARMKATAARAALDEFMRVNGRIIALSRRNTNVRSLALSLNEKRTLTPACEQDLRALNDALAHRGVQKGRWE